MCSHVHSTRNRPGTAEELAIPAPALTPKCTKAQAKAWTSVLAEMSSSALGGGGRI